MEFIQNLIETLKEKLSNKNNLILFISAILIVIAILITCIAVVVDKVKDKNDVDAPSNEIVENVDPTGNNTTAPSTTKNNTTTVATKAGKYKVATKDDPLGIRLQADQDGQRVGEIPKGTEIEVLAVYGDWGYVNYEGIGGWVAMKYLDLVSLSDKAPKYAVGKYTIATQDDPLGIRIKAEDGAERCGEVPKGSEVEILAVCGEWGYVEYNGNCGWLAFKYLKAA